MTKLIQFLRQIWHLARPYWTQSDDRWAARGLLAVIVALNLGSVYLNVLFTEWNNLFYNALQDHNFPEFWHQLFRFSWLAALFIIVAVYRSYLSQMLQIRWRRWLTDVYLAEWLADRTYYHMQVTGAGSDNPDQRIAEDLRLFVEQTLVLSLGIMSAVVTFFSFIAILWTLSGTLEVPLGELIPGAGSIAIPGYMVWVGLVYAVGGTWLTHLIGKPLIRLNYERQRYEADFRFGLIRFRENAEGVALYGGEASEQASFKRQFGAVMTNWFEIMRRTKQINWLTSGYSQIAIIFPFVVAAPRYFAGTITLGGLMQTASAFGQLQSSLSWFVDNYTSVAEWRAIIDRLTGFTRAVDQAQTAARETPSIERSASTTPALAAHHLSVRLPNGRPVLDDVELTIRRGEWVLIMGPSGSGKSTLFRSLAGIWPFAEGELALPAGERVLFLPQKPYLPVDTLARVLVYPDTREIDHAELIEVLQACKLSHLADALDQSANWALRLSPGEQQRIAFARAVLYRPDWLFLDEASAALDEATEAQLYRLLRERLPNATVVSIGHNHTLTAFHDRVLELHPSGDAWTLDGAPVILAAS